MKALYSKGNVPLSDELRAKYRGQRIENADCFNGVARGVTEAEVIGDYPNILAALKDADIPVVGGKPKAKKTAPKAEPKVEPKVGVKPEPVVAPEPAPEAKPEDADLLVDAEPAK